MVNIFEFILANLDRILEYTYNHLLLVLIVVVLSIILWVSLGLLISRYDNFSGPVIGLGNLLFCIPSISFFGIFVTIPYLGLSRQSAVLALLIYSMMPIVRNVYTGITSIDKSVLEAGKGMGMNSREVLTTIQIPMAWPVIFAGIRTTVVMITGIATMATFIGERNLGRLIHHGITRSNSEMIITGAILVSVISIVLDILLGFIETKITSPGLRYHNQK